MHCVVVEITGGLIATSRHGHGEVVRSIEGETNSKGGGDGLMSQPDREVALFVVVAR
jgi:hypothetical protein